MATLEDEIKDLKEKNNELVQKVQYWKMTAGQRENEKLNLMKEINELRLKLGRYRSNSDVQARNLDAALQSASEKALAHLVRASSEIARTIELTKTYMRERQEPEACPRWSAISGSPTEKSEKVHRVPPMMGGRSIQPVVALSRTVLNTSNPRSATGSPTQSRSRNVTERAEPIHVLQARLQDAYIPLTRIDAELNSNMEIEMDAEDEADDSSEELEVEDSGERLEDSHNISDVAEEYDMSTRLDAVAEDIEPEDEDLTSSRRVDNPLEGPSWLLDTRNKRKPGTLEPDSTTEIEPSASRKDDTQVQKIVSLSQKRGTSNGCGSGGGAGAGVPGMSVRVSCAFSPTVRRRKRPAEPAEVESPTPVAPVTPPHNSSSTRRNSTSSGRVLKVLVAKMHLEAESPPTPKRATPCSFVFDAPSPNGATVSGVIVSESSEMETDAHAHGEPAPARAASRCDSRASHDSTRSHDSFVSRRHCSRDRDGDRDSDSGSGSASGAEGSGRTRRPRKVVEYKEKPLNRKMRR